ncbi:hypothetical protein Peur_057235 [Populus x canadensis]
MRFQVGKLFEGSAESKHCLAETGFLRAGHSVSRLCRWFFSFMTLFFVCSYSVVCWLCFSLLFSLAFGSLIFFFLFLDNLCSLFGLYHVSTVSALDLVSIYIHLAVLACCHGLCYVYTLSWIYKKKLYGEILL